MKRLQVKTGNGSWIWVFCRQGETGALVTTTTKNKALPPCPFQAFSDLDWARHTWPDREFRLGERLDMELPLPDVPVSPVASGMDRTIDIALNALRDRGYACVVFSPEQLNGMSADALESGLVKDGMQRIEFQQDEEV